MRFLKKLLALSLAAILAVSMTGMSKEPEDPAVASTQYIAENKAADLAISEIKKISSCTSHFAWNTNTKIDSTVKLYDYDGNVNSYLFRLTTSSKPTGYALVNADSKSASMETACDEGDSALDIMFKKNHHRLPNTNDHIICVGAFDFVQPLKDGHFQSVETQKCIDASKQELKSDYRQSILNNEKTFQSSSRKIENKDSTHRISTSTYYRYHELPNLVGWRPFVTSDFSGDDYNCVPTAATTFVNYWAKRHPNKNPALWTGYPYETLKNYTGWNPANQGAYPENIIPALTRYGAEYTKQPICGDDYRWDGAIDWNFLTDKLSSNLPLIVCVQNHPKYGNHAVVAFGYQDFGTCYLLIADGWTTSSHTLLQYTYNTTFHFAGYVRWH